MMAPILSLILFFIVPMVESLARFMARPLSICLRQLYSVRNPDCYQRALLIRITGMHAIKDRPVVVDGQIVIRPIMVVALTYDHRLLDGREAVTFLGESIFRWWRKAMKPAHTRAPVFQSGSRSTLKTPGKCCSLTRLSRDANRDEKLLLETCRCNLCMIFYIMVFDITLSNVMIPRRDPTGGLLANRSTHIATP